MMHHQFVWTNNSWVSNNSKSSRKHPTKSLTWLAGTSTMNESMYFLLKMGIFQPVMLVFYGVSSDCHVKVYRIWGPSGYTAPCCHGHIQPRDMRIEARSEDTCRRFGVVGNVGLRWRLKNWDDFGVRTAMFTKTYRTWLAKWVGFKITQNTTPVGYDLDLAIYEAPETCLKFLGDANHLKWHAM